MKNKNYEISINENDNIEIIDEVNLEDGFITQENAKDVWNYIKNNLL